MKSIVLIFLGIISVNLVFICKADCDTGWFGSNCQYQCHCLDGCDANGFCKTQKCASNWFGYKCQYQYFVNSLQVTSGNSAISYNLWTDQDTSTCISEISIKQLLITLRYKTPFLFLRLVVGDSAVIYKFIVQLEDSYDYYPIKRYPCRKQTFTVSNNRTVDIRCENTELVNRVILEGDGVTSLCSINVNGGRNVALKQQTEQTSTNGTHYASYAVDGTLGGNCTLTNNVTDVSPTWTLTFEEPMIVTAFEISTAGEYPMYQYFYYSRLQTLDVNNNFVYNYTSWSTLQLSTRNINSIPLKKVQITANNSSYVSTPILSICEAVVYGACQRGKWNWDCKQQCDSKCQDFCSEWDGSCPTFCLGYQAPGCNVECSFDKWGVNCREDCSDRCQNKYCNNFDGLCTAGCNAYSDPPYCTKACVKGYYGLNCKSKCSSNCPNGTCDQRNGTCLQTCGPNHQGPFCDETYECPSEKWGVNCREDCSDRCQYKYCNNVDGLCTSGCNGYSDPPYCTKACVMGFYGINCSNKCSSNCTHEECDQRNGTCLQTCNPNHQGSFCEETYGIETNKESFSLNEASFGIGIVVGIVVGVILVLLVVAVIKVRKRKVTTQDNTKDSGTTDAISRQPIQYRNELWEDPDPSPYVNLKISHTNESSDYVNTEFVNTN